VNFFFKEFFKKRNVWVLAVVYINDCPDQRYVAEFMKLRKNK